MTGETTQTTGLQQARVKLFLLFSERVGFNLQHDGRGLMDKGSAGEDF